MACLFASLLWTAAAHAATATTWKGAYAMQGGQALTDGYLRTTPLGQPLRQRLDMWMTRPASAKALTQYTVEMTKKLHVIIVSADFGEFMHIHPTLNAQGHFVIDQTFPRPGPYHVFVDGRPEDLEHQVFRFDITVGGPTPRRPMQIAATGREVNAGPYTVDLSKVRVATSGMEMLNVNIQKAGKPAGDLRAYLGASAHAVFVNSKTLSYVHVHPMSMSDMMSGSMKELPENAKASPDLMLHLVIKEPGAYKVWLQFLGGGKLHVAPFVVTAQ